MKKITFLTTLLCGTLFFLSLSGFNYSPSPVAASIVVIVNKDNPISTLSAGEVKLYWLRKIKTRWPDINKNIKPVDRKTKCSEQEVFYWKVLSMTSDEVETYFVTKQYQNAQKPQDKFNSDNDVINFVGEEIGAIGFINANSLSAEAKAKVKVVLTI